ncbi:hypothetical protein [Haloplanus rallus]|uniref:hypothetical protein n=1 Tax=Haloplanus rallus TaxID=1816183 RepID=UPI0018EE6451|nr:hypothetical protein [Haloplanus rallus]
MILPAAVADGDPDQAEIRGINYRETYDYLSDNYEMAVSREEFLELYESAAADLYQRAELIPGSGSCSPTCGREGSDSPSSPPVRGRGSNVSPSDSTSTLTCC